MYIKKRWFVVIISYFVAALAVLAGFIVLKNGELVKNGNSMSAPYRESVANLSSSLSSINYSLEKGMYATSPYQAMVLAANVWLESGSAKSSIETLPIYDLSLDNTSKFLSQVGEYTFYLAKKAVNGDEITDEEKESLRKMSETAATLSSEVQGLQSKVLEENLDYKGFKKLLSRQETAKDRAKQAIAGQYLDADGAGNAGEEGNGGDIAGDESEEISNPFQKIEMSFADGYELNYDGLFSDHIMKSKSDFLEAKPSLSQDDACDKAGYVMDFKPDNLKCDGEVENNNMPCYVFSDQMGRTIEITKNGGFVYGFSNSRDIGDINLSDDEAVTKAIEFLDMVGYKDMKQVYYRISDNMLDIIFATESNGVTVYPEKVSVGVALDNGEIVFCEAADYLMHRNTSRTLNEKCSKETAEKVLSDNLTVEDYGLAIIASDGGNETFCHEFKTKTAEGKTVVVYINAENGREEKISIVEENDNGIFIM